MFVSNVVPVQKLEFSKRNASLFSIKCSSSTEFDNVSSNIGFNLKFEAFSPSLVYSEIFSVCSSEQYRCEGEKRLSDSLSWWSREENEKYEEDIDVNLRFALPGKERQDSVYNGLQEIDVNSELVCIHDSARPLVNTEDVEKVLKDGYAVGAAVLGVQAKATIKEVNSDSLVVKTLDRKTLWEMQTPQVIKPELLKKGFELVKRF